MREFPILKYIDKYLLNGGEIRKQHGRICLIDKEGDYIISGKTTQEMLENLITLIG